MKVKIKLYRDDIIEACRMYVNDKFMQDYATEDIILHIENEDGIVEGCDPVVEVEVEA